MLKGKELGEAIEKARIAKKVSKVEIARVMCVSPPSVSGWVKDGRISTEKLLELISYFSDVVPIDSWGLSDNTTSMLNGLMGSNSLTPRELAKQDSNLDELECVLEYSSNWRSNSSKINQLLVKIIKSAKSDPEKMSRKAQALMIMLEE